MLTAALGFLEIGWRGGAPAAADALRRWLDSWSGIGHVISGMHRQGFDVELRQLAEAWRANFYPAGIAHSMILGSAWEPTPWRAVQRAAWRALNNPRAG